jgi:hypothetical protein
MASILGYPPRFQWRQYNAPCRGSSCCTDTCIQMIVNWYKDKVYSLSYIRQMAQRYTNYNEGSCTGINHIEVMNALKAFGIYHYRTGFGADAGVVWDKVPIGPVIVGVHYGSYPSWYTHTSRPNRAHYGGRTDYGFRGAHAVLAVGRRKHTVGVKDHRDIFVRDPDHYSYARPERPKYDIITNVQLNRAMKNLVPYTPFTNTYIIYPTQKKPL